MSVNRNPQPSRRKSTRVRTALTAAAIIAGGVITGTLLALSPLLDEVSSMDVPRYHQSLDLRGTSTIAEPRAAIIPRHEPQPHLLHGVRRADRAHEPRFVNL